MEITNLPDKEFNIMIIKTLNKLRRKHERGKKINKGLENMKKDQTELQNTITEIKITLEGINSSLMIQNTQVIWKIE